MQKLGLNELREKYLSFFEGKGHLRAPSFPLLPKDDNSLLFINSGMAPLKPYFSGEISPPSVRMTTCQKCVRTPDIENVGKTSRHGTFFEMLGNFSFGDYFKREAAAWAWEFITKVLEIPKDLLYISVYLDDDEAFDIWTKEIGISPDRMVRLGKADNFWEIGSGPCGPCSEIYFDRGEQNGCGSPDCAPGCDCDRYVEFWNLVFSQFNNDGEGNYTPLAQKNIDTGMGLERLACIMQGVDNLFEVDTIQNILQTAAKTAGKTYKQNERDDISLRVITDHIRSVTMMVCDGALPSNEGRGYVLRRLLRRAARHGRLLGINKPFLFELAETVIRESGAAYPELAERREYITRVIKVEEERFEQTIDAGMRMLNHINDKLENEFVFKLYDTYGFPVELTEEILSERGITVDREAFNKLMDIQRKRARAARAALGDTGWEKNAEKGASTRFVGYDALGCEASVTAVTDTSVVLDFTPFYAESGGQVADRGVISSDSADFEVEDVKKTKDGQFVHVGKFTKGSFAEGDLVTATVSKPRRDAIRRAHSATHLLHKALREVLGNHVEQAGSLVEPDRLRFDFTHFEPMSDDEFSRVSALVLDAVYDGLEVGTDILPIDEARKRGAMALFGEKYGETVRVVSMGGYSVELCGGTHVRNTAQVGSFEIAGRDASVAAGVRRIEAIVGREVAAQTHIRETQYLENIEDLRKKLKDRENILAKERIAAAKAFFTANDGVFLTDWDDKTIKNALETLRGEFSGKVLIIASEKEQKFGVAAGENTGKKAGDIVKAICEKTGGRGGGRADIAMGGGDVQKIGEEFSL